MPTTMAPLVRIGRRAGLGDLQQGHRSVPPCAASRSLDVGGEALDEHQGSHLPRGAPSESPAVVDRARAARRRRRAGARRPAGGERLDRRRASRPRRGASRHAICCIRNSARHRGVVLGADRHAAELAQVRGALQRILQALVRLVDAHRPLHRRPLRRGAAGRRSGRGAPRPARAPPRGEIVGDRARTGAAGRTVRSRRDRKAWSEREGPAQRPLISSEASTEAL